MSTQRTFEYTDEDVKMRFAPGGDLDSDAVMDLPTLFMNEGRDAGTVTVGWLSRIRRRGGGYSEEYQFDYRRDPDVPHLSNADIYRLKIELEIDEFEFSRNHWAVKNVDLFSVLYRFRGLQLPRPTVFQLSDKPIVARRVSMMMPFSASFDATYHVLKNAIEEAGYECRRADDFWVNEHIMQDIIELLCTSEVVICDLSHKNPNVFYETGVAHMLGKSVILITQSIDDVPFDLRPIRCLSYLPNGEGRQRVANEIVSRLQLIEKEGRET